MLFARRATSDGLTESDLMVLNVSDRNHRDKDASYRLYIIQCPNPLSQPCTDESPVSEMVV